MTARMLSGGLALFALFVTLLVVRIYVSRTRRTRELKAGPRRFHWTMVSGYMGKADPTALKPANAAKILQKGWSCEDAEVLRKKLSKYRVGEMNDAFDASRIVWLAELATAANWFSAAELTEWSTAACQRVRAAYRSWGEYESALIDGWQRWWPEVQNAPMPPDDQARMTRIRTESKPLFAAVPWSP